MKRKKISILFVIRITMLLFFVLGCKKDPQISPPVITAPIVETPPLEISIYPNPTRGIFTVQTNATVNETVQIYNNIGKLQLSQIINGTTRINADSLIQGVYIVKVITNGNTLIKRLIIIR